jgi:CRISPR-associated protein Csd1
LLPVRASLIRLCLNDLCPDSLIKEALDPTFEEPAYLWGRLLAVCESVQYVRSGASGIRMIDRWYVSASTHPAPCFRMLVAETKTILQRLLRGDKRGAGVVLERLVAHLQERLAAAREFAQLPFGLEDQGRFSLGYYQQRADSVVEARKRQPPR